NYPDKKFIRQCGGRNFYFTRVFNSAENMVQA
ncbi:unnamed protein product, partial [marine sediment metagenome]